MKSLQLPRGEPLTAVTTSPASIFARAAGCGAGSVPRIVLPWTLMAKCAATVTVLTMLPLKIETGRTCEIVPPAAMPVPRAEIVPLLLILPVKVDTFAISMPTT